MTKQKYIVGEFPCDGGTCFGAVLFPSEMFHYDVARRLGGKCTSAGFYHINKGEVEVYGRSESLNLDSKPSDADYIEMLLIL